MTPPPAAAQGRRIARPKISVKDQVTVAIRQVTCEGFLCPLCREELKPEEPRILEHLVARATRVALGLDPDALDILAWVHKWCADKKTYGNKATCADGDIHKIAKAKRIRAATEVHKAVVSRVITREPSRLKGRGFDKTKTRRFDGKVVSRD